MCARMPALMGNASVSGGFAESPRVCEISRDLALIRPVDHTNMPMTTYKSFCDSGSEAVIQDFWMLFLFIGHVLFATYAVGGFCIIPTLYSYITNIGRCSCRCTYIAVRWLSIVFNFTYHIVDALVFTTLLYYAIRTDQEASLYFMLLTSSYLIVPRFIRRAYVTYLLSLAITLLIYYVSDYIMDRYSHYVFVAAIMCNIMFAGLTVLVWACAPKVIVPPEEVELQTLVLDRVLNGVYASDNSGGRYSCTQSKSILSLLGLGESRQTAIVADISLFVGSLIACRKTKGGQLLAVASLLNLWIARGYIKDVWGILSDDVLKELAQRASKIVLSPKASQAVDEVDEAQLQSGFDGIGSLLGKISGFLTGDFAKNLSVLCALLFGIMFFRGEDGKFDLTRFTALEKNFQTTTNWNTVSGTLTNLAECFRFFLGKGCELYRTGNVSEFLCLEDRFTRWSAEVSATQIEHFRLTVTGKWSDLIVHNSKLAKLRDEGTQIIKISRAEDKTKINKVILSIDSMLSEMTVRFKSSGLRYQPFAAIISGGSKVIKSQFTLCLINHYAQVLGIPYDEKTAIHWFNNDDGFFAGYHSGHFATCIDEVGAHISDHSNRDPAIDALLKMANNIPFIVPMADLPSKGNVLYVTPLVVATTNDPTLNLRKTHVCASAVMRRFQMHISLSPKPQYAASDGSIDTSKIAELKGSYPDFWCITVRRALVTPKGHEPRYETIGKFNNMADFLKFSTVLMKEHDANQTNALNTSKNIFDMEYCDVCREAGIFLPSTVCDCNKRDVDDHADDCSTDTCSECEDPIVQSGISTTSTNWALMICTRVYLVIVRFLVFVVNHSLSCDSITFAAIQSYLQSHALILELIVARQRVTRSAAIPTRLMPDALEQPTRLSWIKSKWVFRLSLLAALIALINIGRTYLCAKAGTQSGDDDLPLGSSGEPNAASNPYYRAIFKGFEPISAPSRSVIGSKDPDLSQAVELATYRGRISSVNGGGITSVNNIVKLSGGIFMVSNHALPQDGAVRIEVVRTGEACDGSFEIILNQDHITRDPHFDVALFHQSYGDKSGIQRYFAQDDIRVGLPGYLLTRRSDGVKKITFNRIDHTGNPYRGSASTNDSVSQVVNLVGGKPSEPTVAGDCGALIVALHGEKMHPVIVGMHMIRVGGNSFGPRITSGDITRLVQAHKSRISNSQPFNFIPNPLESLPQFETNLTGVELQLRETHPKSAVNYMRAHAGTTEMLPMTTCYGSLERPFTSRFKSAFRKSDMYEDVLSAGYPVDKVLPSAPKPWSPEGHFIGDISSPYISKQPATLIHASANAYYNRCFDSCNKSDLGKITMDDAINGIPSSKYIGPIDMSTSAGFGVDQTKSKVMVKVSTNPVRYAAPPGVVKDIEDAIVKYNRHERASPIFKATKKDEVISPSKAEVGKIRIICASPLWFLILTRMYLSRFVSWYQTYQDLSEGCPGIAAQGPGWTKLYNDLCVNPKDRCIAGDFKGYDKTVVSGNFLGHTISVIYRLVSPQMKTDEDLRILQGICSDLANPLIDLFGTLISGSLNSSGNPITVVINGITNSLIMRCAYTILHPLTEIALDGRDINARALFLHEIPSSAFMGIVTEFDSVVVLRTYGDDNIATVALGYDWFNHQAIATAMATMGVEYTRADKSNDVMTYCHISVATFLKRYFVEPDGSDIFPEFVRAPLELPTFGKMIAFHRCSSYLSSQAVDAASLSSFLFEHAQLGRTKYNEASRFVSDMLDKYELWDYFTYTTNGSLKSYDEVMHNCYSLE